jgi:uncharacterized protein
MRALLASPFGFLIGLSLGALGGGGSILAVPMLVYIAGQDPKAATASSLILVTMTSLVGIVPHYRAGRVRVVPGLLFGLAGVGAAVLGSKLNESVNEDVLLLLFSIVMYVAGFGMWRSANKRRAAQAAVRSLSAAANPTPSATATAATATAVHFDLATVVKVLLAGSAVGLMTGFFGVGGGFVIVPALVLALGFAMPEAVGTSLLIIIINSLVALAMRFGQGGVEWDVVLPFAISSLAGVIVGGRLAGSKDPTSLQRVFVFLLAGVATYTMISSILALI